MSVLVTGTPGSGKTTLVQYAEKIGNVRFVDADEVIGLCEWREFLTDKPMGLITEFVETGKDDWYAQYGWYWRVSFLKDYLAQNPDVILCGSSENVTNCYELFDRIVVIRVGEDELLRNLADLTRNNPFGKTPKQRAGFMKWQDHLIDKAHDHKTTLIDGNNTANTYQQITQASWIDEELLQQFAFNDNTFTAMRLTGGFQHEVWLVSGTSASIVLKRQKDTPNQTAIALEQAGIKHNIAVAPSIITQNNEPWVMQDGYYIRAYQNISGSALDRTPVPEEVARELGKQLALLHDASIQEFGVVEANSFELPKAVFSDQDHIANVIKDAAKEFIEDFDPSNHILLIGHRDIGGKNTIIEDASRKPYLIDFDEAGVTTLDGEVIDAAFNLAGVHSERGAQKEVVQAFVNSYRETTKHQIAFDRSSFHMLIGMSECWWLSECYRRVETNSIITREQEEIQRLTQQIPNDVAHIEEWLIWLS